MNDQQSRADEPPAKSAAAQSGDGLRSAPSALQRAGAPERAPRIAGEIIRQALLGEVSVPADCPLKLDKLGARLEGAIIEGGLNLAAIEFDKPIAFERCTFAGAIELCNARIRALSFADSKAIAIDVSSARIDGDFDLRGVLLNFSAALALDGVDIHVGGFLRCSEGFTCLGMIDLRAARIDGSLDFGRATLCSPYPGNREDFFRHLLGGGGAPAAALNLQNAKIGGGLSFSNGFHAEGIVFLGAARIAGNLSVATASFVSGGGGFSGLLVANVRVEGLMMFLKISAFEGELLLDGARTTRFSDDSSLWRDATGALRKGVALELDQFRYDAFQDTPISPARQDWRTQLAWLKMQGKANLTTSFHAQPFTQCAEVSAQYGRCARQPDDLVRARAHAAQSEECRVLGEDRRACARRSGWLWLQELTMRCIGRSAFGSSARLCLALPTVLGEMRPADPHVLVETRYQRNASSARRL